MSDTLNALDMLGIWLCGLAEQDASIVMGHIFGSGGRRGFVFRVHELSQVLDHRYGDGVRVGTFPRLPVSFSRQSAGQLELGSGLLLDE